MKIEADTRMVRLIAGCVEGDRQCQRQLYDWASPTLCALARRYAYTPEVVDDILIESFVKIFTRINTFDGATDQQLIYWCRRIVINTALDFYRLQRRREQPLSEVLPREEPSPAKTALQSLEQRDLVHKAMCILSQEQRTLVNAIAVDGYHFHEMAQRLECPLSTVKTQYYRALQRLRQTINQLEGINSVSNSNKTNSVSKERKQQ